MIDKYQMTNHKLYWHLDRVSDWMNGEKIAPLHIDLGVTTGCNIFCKYCYGTVMKRTNVEKRFDMPLDVMKNLFRDCKDIGVKSIAITGEGENTLNPYFYDALNYARSISLDLGLATNGVSIKKNRIKEMLESLIYLRFNISAATPDSYKIVHGVDYFDRVIDNIRECVKIKNKKNIKVTIGLQMVIINENFDQIIPLAKLGKEIGVDYLVAKPCSDTFDGKLNAPHKKYVSLEDVCKQAETNSDEKYSVIIKWKKLKNEGLKPFKTCYGTAFMIAINGRGDVAPCGHLFNPTQKEEFHMGNIIEKPFRDIVFSDRYWEVQKKVQNLNVNRDCESNCKQYYICEFLESLLNPPMHVNFP
jgi:radical SAM protein with 4Fe4S-binding SPASM domain